MKKQTWNNFWDEYGGPSRAERWLINERINRIISLFKKNNLRNIKTLEGGCGFASTSKILKKMGVRTYCLDNSDIVIQKIKNEIKDSYVGDAMNLPFKSDSFDLVFSEGLIEHFQNPEKIIKEMFRVTKKGGFFVNFVPGKYSLWQVYKILHGKNWKHGYEENYTHQKLIMSTKIALKNAKFKIIDARGIDPFSITGLLLKISKINFNIRKSINKNAYTEIYQIY